MKYLRMTSNDPYKISALSAIIFGYHIQMGCCSVTIEIHQIVSTIQQFVLIRFAKVIAESIENTWGHAEVTQRSHIGVFELFSIIDYCF